MKKSFKVIAVLALVFGVSLFLGNTSNEASEFAPSYVVPGGGGGGGGD